MNFGEKEMVKKCGRRNKGRRWRQRRVVCDIYCFSHWKGKLVLFWPGAQRVLRNRKEADLPILTDSWCPPIAVPSFLLATYNGSHPDPGHLETNPSTYSLLPHKSKHYSYRNTGAMVWSSSLGSPVFRPTSPYLRIGWSICPIQNQTY